MSIKFNVSGIVNKLGETHMDIFFYINELHLVTAFNSDRHKKSWSATHELINLDMYFTLHLLIFYLS